MELDEQPITIYFFCKQKEIKNMEVVNFFETANRYCDMTDCSDCKIIQNGYCCIDIPRQDIEHIVGLLEIWKKEHPVKTNRQKFEEVFGCKYEEPFCPPIECAGSVIGCTECRRKWLNKEYIEPKE